MIKCSLDEDGCIDLMTVLRIVNQIDQEQAWAICFGLGHLMQRLLPPTNCALIESLAHIQLHKEGFVHEKSCLLPSPTTTTTTTSLPTTPPTPTTTTTTTTTTTSQPEATPTETTISKLEITTSTPPLTPEPSDSDDAESSLVCVGGRRAATSEQELVASLGTALFWALDYNIPNDKERQLNRAMECLIIQSQSQLQLRELMEICIKRLPPVTAPEQHYRAILKTLINDTIQLSIFLEKIYTASMVLSDITLDDCLDHHHHHLHHHLQNCDILRQHQRHHDGQEDDDDDDGGLSELGEPLASLRALRINDWARLWMQVIRELRQMGKFKQALLVN